MTIFKRIVFISLYVQTILNVKRNERQIEYHKISIDVFFLEFLRVSYANDLNKFNRMREKKVGKLDAELLLFKHYDNIPRHEFDCVHIYLGFVCKIEKGRRNCVQYLV